MPWFSVFVDQTNLKIIWKFSLSQYRCHKTLIDVENCVKSALNSNHIKLNFTVITNWGGGDYQLRSMLASKQIWVAVITIWGTLDSLPRLTWEREMQADVILKEPPPWVPPLSLSGGAHIEGGGGHGPPPFVRLWYNPSIHHTPRNKISKRLSTLSNSEEIFDNELPIYSDTLKTFWIQSTASI